MSTDTMNDASTYTPSRNSLPGRVAAFFAANPEEELTLDDITEKFDAVTSSIHTLLQHARSANLIVRDKDAAGDWIYKRGAALAADVEPVAATPRTLPWKPAAAPAAAAVEVDPLTVTLETGVPLSGPARGRAKQDWSQLLHRMQAGHSCVLPRAKRGQVTKAIKAIKDAGNPGQYTVRAMTDKTSFRLWRTQ